MADSDFFTKRPRRRVCCSSCGGRGWNEETFALAPSDKPIAGSPVESIAASVVGASSIFDACREAKAIAVYAGRPVAFDFNNRLVVVNAGDDPDTIARAWWHDAYGETPEQTAARR
ncbi:MAG TPA: hypothetical protein VLT45_04545 [Kofleriaceae bacterium]|nr:hypothetical protein [Kofleriaceae bacterium]